MNAAISVLHLMTERMSDATSEITVGRVQRLDSSIIGQKRLVTTQERFAIPLMRNPRCTTDPSPPRS
jgi:hypothetical protein